MFTWYKIFNTTEFDALGLVSKTYTYNLQGVGQKSILVTKANGYGITYEGVFLFLNLNDENPFEFDGYAIYSDANDDVHLGIAAQ
jgi:hypothetical protein